MVFGGVGNGSNSDGISAEVDECVRAINDKINKSDDKSEHSLFYLLPLCERRESLLNNKLFKLEHRTMSITAHSLCVRFNVILFCIIPWMCATTRTSSGMVSSAKCKISF